MNLAIRYDTEYRYDQPVSFSTHLYRVLPRVDLHTTVQRTVFVTNAGAAVQFRRDLFDNVVASCFYPGTFDRLQIHVELDLTIAEKNPFDFLLAEHALEFPFRYTGQEARVLGPYLQRTPGAARIPFWLPEPQPTLAALTALNTAIYQNIHYTRRDEGEAYTPEETLRHGCGACRDFAVLLADGLRGAGIAARLASGYLWEDSTAEARRAEGALHAWTEAFLPGAGWVGLDPTNGILCNHNHIATAVGIEPGDVAPIVGRFFADRPVTSTMSAHLELTPS